VCDPIIQKVYQAAGGQGQPGDKKEEDEEFDEDL